MVALWESFGISPNGGGKNGRSYPNFANNMNTGFANDSGFGHGDCRQHGFGSSPSNPFADSSHMGSEPMDWEPTGSIELPVNWWEKQPGCNYHGLPQGLPYNPFADSSNMGSEPMDWEPTGSIELPVNWWEKQPTIPFRLA